MKMQNEFQAWAKLLITRKVPENFSHLINSEVIHSGADILQHGGAFEVHLEQPSRIPNVETHGQSRGGRIFITPIVSRNIPAYAN